MIVRLLLSTALLVSLTGKLNAAPVASRPQALILVAVSPSNQDELEITYSHIVPHAQVKQDIAALAKDSGWRINKLSITDASSALLHDKVVMTAVDSEVTDMANLGSHGLPVAPFIKAFRNYHNIVLTYFIGEGFSFKGLRKFTDKDVDVSLDQHGFVYTYNIHILNTHFKNLNLPFLQPIDTHAKPLRISWQHS